MKHRLRHGHSLLVWDDRTGRVTGSHPDIEKLRELLEGPKPLEIGHYSGTLVLEAPDTDAADFKALVALMLYSPHADFEYPASLRDVTPTEWISAGRGGCDEHDGRD